MRPREAQEAMFAPLLPIDADLAAGERDAIRAYRPMLGAETFQRRVQVLEHSHASIRADDDGKFGGIITGLPGSGRGFQ